ncbi:MAG: O-antigen ligase family protein [Odoribacter splanchnicus]|uniref:O-antigen ligase family protein n=1 Tax=Odoribacter splanchnicus TaxID=28118 RepID=UPI001C010E16|nr:O-antigen ligase family protein [Odoribacter splanchnicus]
MKILRKRQFRLNELDLIFGLFVLYYGSRILITDRVFNPNVPLYTVMLLLLYVYARNIKSGNTFFILLFFAGGLQGIWYILQITDFLPSYHYLLKGTGCFFNPSILALFLVLSFLAGICSFKKEFGIGWKVCWLLNFLLLLYGILSINSRASWIALVMGILWKAARQKYRYPNYLSFILLSVILLIGIYAGYRMRPDSVQGRFLIWQVIGSKLPEALWWGQGSLEALYMPLQAGWFREHSVSAYANVAGNNVYAFNEFLRILFETGIAGFVLFVLLIFTGCRHSFRGNQKSRDAGSVFLAILSFGFFSYPFSIGLIITIAVAALAVIAGNVSSPVLIKGRWKTGYRFVAGLFLLSLPVFICFEYRQEKRADRLLSEAQSDVSVLTGTGMINSYRYLQGNADFVLCYGKTLFNHRQYAEALPVLENACALKPSSRLVCDLGMCYQQAGRNAEAEKAYLSASFMTPAYIVPHYHLFNLYRADGSPGQAAIQAEYMLSMQVKVVNTSVLRIRNQARIFLQNYQPKE